MTTETVTMPTAYLAEKIELLDRLTVGFDGHIANVAVWKLDDIANTCEAIIDEVDRWRAEAEENR